MAIDIRVVGIAIVIRQRKRWLIHVQRAGWTFVHTQYGWSNARHPKAMFIGQENVLALWYLVNVVVTRTYLNLNQRQEK